MPSWTRQERSRNHVEFYSGSVFNGLHSYRIREQAHRPRSTRLPTYLEVVNAHSLPLNPRTSLPLCSDLIRVVPWARWEYLEVLLALGQKQGGKLLASIIFPAPSEATCTRPLPR